MIATTAIGEGLVTTGYQPGLSEWDIAAHHEASHVAAYLFYGLRFRRAVLWLAENGAVEGAVRVGVTANGDYGSTRRAIVCLSGPVGEARCSGVSLRDLLASNIAKADLEMAMDALRCDPRSPPFAVALAATERLVEQQWHRIARLAAELQRRGELGYDECQRIVTARR